MIIIVCNDCENDLDIISKYEKLDGTLIIRVSPCDCGIEEEGGCSWECEEDNYDV